MPAEIDEHMWHDADCSCYDKPLIPGHERVWDVVEWICQDCWEKGLDYVWPCPAQRSTGPEGEQ